jgi:hypothetical protein
MRLIIIFSFLFMTTSITYGDIGYNLPHMEIPDSLAKVVNIDAIKSYIYNRNFENRRIGCIRLGQIKGDEALDLLIRAFDKEPYRPGMEVEVGIRRYTLLAIGQIGSPRAEKTLRDILLDYSGDFIAPQLWNRGDTIDIERGAFDALVNLDPPWLPAFMDSLFNRPDRNRSIRQAAYGYIIQKQIDKKFKSDDEKINYVINELVQMPPHQPIINADKTINLKYIREMAYRDIILRYRNKSVDVINKYLKNIPKADFRIGYLDSLSCVIQGLPFR